MPVEKAQRIIKVVEDPVSLETPIRDVGGGLSKRSELTVILDLESL